MANKFYSNDQIQIKHICILSIQTLQMIPKTRGSSKSWILDTTIVAFLAQVSVADPVPLLPDPDPDPQICLNLKQFKILLKDKR